MSIPRARICTTISTRSTNRSTRSALPISFPATPPSPNSTRACGRALHHLKTKRPGIARPFALRRAALSAADPSYPSPARAVVAPWPPARAPDEERPGQPQDAALVPLVAEQHAAPAAVLRADGVPERQLGAALGPARGAGQARPADAGPVRRPDAVPLAAGGRGGGA